MLLPAAAIGAAKPSGFRFYETEAAWISESAAAHYAGVRRSGGRVVGSAGWTAAKWRQTQLK